MAGDGLWSSSEKDRNGLEANVVDGLFAIARGLEKVAGAIEAHGRILMGEPLTGKKADQATLEQMLGEIEVSVKARNIMKNSGWTLQQWLAASDQEIRRIKYCGQKMINEIKSALDEWRSRHP